MAETLEGTIAPAGSLSMSTSIKALFTAFIAVQAELPTIPKEKVAQTEKFSYSYADLATVMPAILQVLTKHELGLVQTVGQDGQGGTTLTTMLIHASGEWLSDTQTLLLTKQDSQGQGSAITYGRRYGVMSLLGLVAEDDDDGAAASQPQSKPKSRSQAKPTTTPAPKYGESQPELAVAGILATAKRMGLKTNTDAASWLGVGTEKGKHPLQGWLSNAKAHGLTPEQAATVACDCLEEIHTELQKNEGNIGAAQEVVAPLSRLAKFAETVKDGTGEGAQTALPVEPREATPDPVPSES